jgi:drug/metabolite transporter (DMT)-like permease
LCYKFLVLPILLAAISAAVWGSGDFCGGKATQRSNALAVTVFSQVVGLPILGLALLLLPGGSPSVRAIGWGAVAGIAGFVGILLLYRGLAQGAMAIFAPVTAVSSALIPLIVGLALDRAPSPLALAGAGCAIVAIGLVSLTGGGATKVTPRLILLALASGAMFGIFFTLLGRAGGGSVGLWPLLGVRVASVGAGLAMVARTRPSLRLTGAALRWATVAGPLDIGANVLYVLAAARGLLSVVAPVAALYPVSTVLLAFAVDRERVRAVQFAGLGLAATALVLVASRPGHLS